MAAKTKYFCDTCKKEIDGIYGPMIVQVQAPDVTQMCEAGEFCGPECAKAWIDTLPRKWS